MRRTATLLLALLLALGLSACGGDDAGQPAVSQTGEEGTTVTAMFVLLGREEDPDGYLLFDQDTGEAFTLGGVDGSIFPWQDYATGNLLEIAFASDYSVAEIWPAIYYGATGVTLLSQGDPADADQYADAVALHYNPQPQEPPVLVLSWEEELEASGVAHGTSVKAFRCQYHYVDLEGRLGVTELDQGEPVGQDIRDLGLEAPAQVELSLYKTEGDWALERWPAGDPQAAPRPAGLEAAEDPAARLLPAEPGWVYHLTVSPEGGGFLEYLFQA